MKPTLTLLAALLLAPLAALHAASADAKPNILFVITDDIGWGDFRCYNPDGKIPTPAADKLAATGMRFTDAHTTSGVCAPSRYSLLTGNYPWRGRKAGWRVDFHGWLGFSAGPENDRCDPARSRLSHGALRQDGHRCRLPHQAGEESEEAGI